MTERKPPGMDFETWADRQIREAEQRGDFKDLPGFGKPLRSLAAPYSDDWWVREKMRREQLSFLPPVLALRKEAEDALEAAYRAPSERAVRAILDGINPKIAAALRMPPAGPPLGLKPFDPEEVLKVWRERRRERPGEAQGEGVTSPDS
ncbi:DUF1992 domain-containing protein [Streptomyces orinoci]|uniref:DUF1992 domain-containing protein n=1 Tax=Streptomyces orinoci TaxID=67339 RepID=A0ABV3K5H8_STRON|nr:DUF1992 domain-containing protein [Streptomyces orinoci]